MGTPSTNSKRKYNENAYDRIEVTVPKGDKAKYREHAARKDNGSLNSFIKRAMSETMQRDISNAGDLPPVGDLPGLLSRDVSDLGLSVNALNHLKRRKVNTVADFLRSYESSLIDKRVVSEVLDALHVPDSSTAPDKKK